MCTNELPVLKNYDTDEYRPIFTDNLAKWCCEMVDMDCTLRILAAADELVKNPAIVLFVNKSLEKNERLQKEHRKLLIARAKGDKEAVEDLVGMCDWLLELREQYDNALCELFIG